MKKNIDLLKKLELETTNTGVIHLWLEGMFWKAYERSAYVFVRRISGYKPYKRYVRLAGGEVLAIGFPAKSFGKVTDGRTLEVVDGKHCVMSGFTMEAREMKEYYTWKKEVPSFPYTVVADQAEVVQEAISAEKPKGEKKPDREVRNETVTVRAVNPVAESPVRETDRRLTDELRRFRMESATPLECMMFLSKLITIADKD